MQTGHSSLWLLEGMQETKGMQAKGIYNPMQIGFAYTLQMPNLERVLGSWFSESTLSTRGYLKQGLIFPILAICSGCKSDCMLWGLSSSFNKGGV